MDVNNGLQNFNLQNLQCKRYCAAFQIGAYEVNGVVFSPSIFKFYFFGGCKQRAFFLEQEFIRALLMCYICVKLNRTYIRKIFEDPINT